jgi:hypothetical protein
VSERERIARIIDPDEWAFADQERASFPADPHERIYGTPRLRASLAKADAILARPEPSDTVVITAGGDNWFRGVSEGLTDARPHAKAAAAAYEKENMK